MKILMTFALLIMFQLSAAASDTAIHFRKLSYEEAFETAKKEKKAVMLYFQFKGCGACVTLKKNTFYNAEVADYINANFVCLDVDTKSPDGIEINAIYRVKFHPTVIFLDNDEKVTERIVGVHAPTEFITKAKNALNNTNTFIKLKQEYENGNRNPEFLYKCCYGLKDAYELDCLVINEYLKTQSLQDLGKEENIRFIYEFSLHNFVLCTPFNSREYKFMLNNREEFYKYFDKDQVDTRIVWIAQAAAYGAIETQDEQLFKQAIDVITPFDIGSKYVYKRMDGGTSGIINNRYLVLTCKMAYHEKSGNKALYDEALNEYLEKIWNDDEALNEFAWECYEKSDDPVKLEKARKCAARAVELKANGANVDTYACVLYKLGRYDEALEQAEKAVELGKAEGVKIDATEALIVKIKLKQRK